MNEFFDLRKDDQPYFLWVSFNDPHYQWDTGENPPDPATLDVPGYLPDTPGVREDLSLHEGEIEHCDGLFKDVLEVAKTRAGLENTLVIFMGDNGMALPSGKGSLHDPGLNVPLLAWWPGLISPGGDSSVLLSGEDIAPTCLEAAGLSVPERMTGVSFLPLLRGNPFPNQRELIFAERGPHGTGTYTIDTPSSQVDFSRCVRNSRYKLIYNVTPFQKYAPVDSAADPGWQDILDAHEQRRLPTEFELKWFANPRPVYELFDLENDPNELNNLYGQPELDDVTLKLKQELQAKMITDFDYLPLPLPGKVKEKHEARPRNYLPQDDTPRS